MLFWAVTSFAYERFHACLAEMRCLDEMSWFFAADFSRFDGGM
jgi:hypothetical protein